MVNFSHAALNGVFSALADPTRRAIVHRLSQGETNMGTLSQPFEMSLPAITKHMRILEKAGLVTRSKQGRKIICRLNPNRLSAAALWVEQQTQQWQGRLDRLEEVLNQTDFPSANDPEGNRLESTNIHHEPKE